MSTQASMTQHGLASSDAEKLDKYRWARRERKKRQTMRVHGRGTKVLAKKLQEKRKGS